jgi:cytidylate kinase
MSSPSDRPALVTLSAPFGAGGSRVGPALAERLGVQFLDRAIPVAVSERLDMPVDEALGHEQIPRDTLSRWLSAFVPAAQFFSGAPAVTPSIKGDDEFRQATEAVLQELAARGGVILGRAGAVVLRDTPGALHVRLDGPPERRVRQGMRLEVVNEETAREMLRASDVAREAYVRQFYGVDPADARLYHLVIDSTVIPLESCVEIIMTAVAARAHGAPPAA